jgi:uncharacterized radical SAM superfamily Fe-S cluster-containing enzyme
MATNAGVFLERLCPENGVSRCKIADSYQWYMERALQPQVITDPKNKKISAQGCPKDCGLCQWHTSSLKLPVFSITNDCNLDCPICFTYNRKDKKYYKSIEDAEKIFDVIQHNGDVQLINMTGGEPTLHPQLAAFIEAAYNKGIKRVTVNTNGIRIADDPGLARQLKNSGAHMVLSLDTFDPEKSKIIHGKDITEFKRKALQVLESLDIPTTILPVCIKNLNEDDVAEIVNEYLGKSFIRSITIQNMTYTGKNGARFEPIEHITIDEVETLLSRNGMISQEDFFTPGSYHPLCYSVAYYICDDDTLYPLSKVLNKEELSELTRNSYFLNPDRDFSKEFRDGIHRLWAEGEDEGYVNAMKKILQKFYPADKNLSREERNNLGEKMIKLLYIHPHMDEYNFDIDRVSRCGDLVPDESGELVPACSYNLLYRQKDPRFWEKDE